MSDPRVAVLPEIISALITQGWTLEVKTFSPPGYVARVWKDTRSNSHNHANTTPALAVAGLEGYLEQQRGLFR